MKKKCIAVVLILILIVIIAIAMNAILKTKGEQRKAANNLLNELVNG